MSREEEKKPIVFKLNGKTVEAKRGETIMQCADRLGVYIPRYCYHDDLSIVASCRMCLVDVEGVEKPTPSCAREVTDGMHVHTRSKKALDAQKAIMEFLLINHPLDCPVCDQGGECELQDFAVGYGKDVSRYDEPKRVVIDQDLGPLIDTHMTRCIHCSRCVRFGREVAGCADLGTMGRGEDMRIETSLEKAMVSELSGNVIDLCPVGALTSKPYRFTGRSWSFKSHPSIGMHDGLGAYTAIHTHEKGYGDRVDIMRVVPRENGLINHVWMQDRDRFSYQGLSSEERGRVPMIKKNGQWQKVTIKEALLKIAEGLQNVLNNDKEKALGVLTSPSLSLEDGLGLYTVLEKLAIDDVDHRLYRHGQCIDDEEIIRPLSINPKDFTAIDTTIMLGAYPAREVPLMCIWLKQACDAGKAVYDLNPKKHEHRFEIKDERRMLADDGQMMVFLLGCFKVLAEKFHIKVKDAALQSLIEQQKIAPISDAFVEQWMKGETGVLMFGSYAMSGKTWPWLEALGHLWVEMTERGHVFTIRPGANGFGLSYIKKKFFKSMQTKACEKIWADEKKVYWLIENEIEHDLACFAHHKDHRKKAEQVVYFSRYFSKEAQEHGDVYIPLSDPTQYQETFMNFMGGVGSTKPIKGVGPEKVMPLRVYLNDLAELMGLDTKHFSENINGQMHALREDNGQDIFFESDQQKIERGYWQKCKEGFRAEEKQGLYRIGLPWIYGVDTTLRRAEALSRMAEIYEENICFVNKKTLDGLAITSHSEVVLEMAGQKVQVMVKAVDDMVENVLWFSGSVDKTPRGFGPWLGEISISKELG